MPRQHFEVIMWGGAPFTGPASEQCEADSTWCLCWNDFNALIKRNTRRGIYVALEDGSQHSQQMLVAANALGNGAVYYMNDMNGYRSHGNQAAAAMWKDACNFWGSCRNVPKFWILNEILGDIWPESSYMQWIINFVGGLVAHGVKPIVAVSNQWSSDYNSASASGLRAIVRKGGYLGLELYQTGAQVEANGFSYSRTRAFYASPQRYIYGLGIPKSKVFMFEDYGNTAAGSVVGRAGVSHASWLRVIKLRNQAIASLNFAGTMTYGWWDNQMRDPPSIRDEYYAAHVASRKKLP